MKQLASFFIALAASTVMATSCQESMQHLSDRVFEVATQQYTLLDSNLGPDQFARTFIADTVQVTGLKWWCSGFPAGTYWYIYEYTGDPAIKELALKHTKKMENILDYPTHHDIGFQINDSYGHAYRLTGDQSYLPLIKASAERLASRFSPVACTIKSWDEGAWNHPVIIDNMMNLELLENASKLFLVPEFDEVARTHANTTMANHFRPDYSVYHLLDYDTATTGEVLKKQTVQGYSDESCWSRGEAWALYGYTMMYRETKDEAYLEQAEKIAEYILTVLPEDGIPYWDFNAPGTPNAFTPDAVGAPEVYAWEEGEPVKRDASAGAVMASALVDLSRLTHDADAAKTYLATAEKMLRTFASDEYLAKPGEIGGFILKHSVGNLHGSKKGPTEVDVPLTYADYYFLEALVKYNQK